MSSWDKPKKAKVQANVARKTRLLATDPHCHYCRIPLNMATATIDHIVPKSKGGTLIRANTTLACRKCQEVKGARPHEDFCPCPAGILAQEALDESEARSMGFTHEVWWTTPTVLEGEDAEALLRDLAHSAPPEEIQRRREYARAVREELMRPKAPKVPYGT